MRLSRTSEGSPSSICWKIPAVSLCAARSLSFLSGLLIGSGLYLGLKRHEIGGDRKMVLVKKKRKRRKKNQGDEVRAEIQFIGGSMIVRPLMISLSEEQFHGIRREALVRGIDDCKVEKTFHGLAFSVPVEKETAAKKKQSHEKSLQLGNHQCP